MKTSRGILWLCAFLFVAGVPTLAQSKKETQLRTVQGLVSDKSDKPILNGVVFLKNLRTNAVISHFTDGEGNYRFTGLDPNIEYEISAEFDGQKSAVRSVSPLDSRKEITLNLKVDRKKS